METKKVNAFRENFRRRTGINPFNIHHGKMVASPDYVIELESGAIELEEFKKVIGEPTQYGEGSILQLLAELNKQKEK